MEAVQNWLDEIGMGKYGPTFRENGWASPETVHLMEQSDVERVVPFAGHARLIHCSKPKIQLSGPSCSKPEESVSVNCRSKYSNGLK